MTGTTGKNVAVPQDVLDYFDACSQRIAGAGVRRLRHPQPRAGRAHGAHVDGVIVGSALVEVLERGATALPRGCEPALIFRMLQR